MIYDFLVAIVITIVFVIIVAIVQKLMDIIIKYVQK